MRARVRNVGRTAVLKLSGKIAVGSGEQALEDVVAGLLEGGVSRIVLDLERVSYMDSSGLGSLVAARRAASEMGAELALLRPGGKVLDLLQLSGLLHMFPIYDDESKAVAQE